MHRILDVLAMNGSVHSTEKILDGDGSERVVGRDDFPGAPKLVSRQHLKLKLHNMVVNATPVGKNKPFIQAGDGWQVVDGDVSLATSVLLSMDKSHEHQIRIRGPDEVPVIELEPEELVEPDPPACHGGGGGEGGSSEGSAECSSVLELLASYDALDLRAAGHENAATQAEAIDGEEMDDEEQVVVPGSKKQKPPASSGTGSSGGDAIVVDSDNDAELAYDIGTWEERHAGGSSTGGAADDDEPICLGENPSEVQLGQRAAHEAARQRRLSKRPLPRDAGRMSGAAAHASESEVRVRVCMGPDEEDGPGAMQITLRLDQDIPMLYIFSNRAVQLAMQKVFRELKVHALAPVSLSSTIFCLTLARLLLSFCAHSGRRSPPPLQSRLALTSFTTS